MTSRAAHHGGRLACVPGFGTVHIGYPSAMVSPVVGRVLWEGMVAGAVGATVMTVGEKLEQRLTGRPDSMVPGRTLARVAGLPERTGKESVALNWAMHYGQAIALGPLRSLMAHAGLRGPVSSAKFAVVRLTNDQILENATGVGAPPETWPRGELTVDLIHKSVYAFATGLFADALVKPLPTSSVKRPAQRLRLPGFA